ncbi:NtaA/DmoA family FMN-dependent monooxygenase [Nocardia sp. 348MFTsu5.1]|uniref:NtaA/DmoA family FMN-dependent monooxygenase n=1 Tax=Nocardia sp. 348MFTsu5.1 TaxID=1172185 RepID=UPI00048D125D|nr:NtaA/DmoA family FMN-dependent monooxygenase [Nocardia sp. 348MFTsu5.1]
MPGAKMMILGMQMGNGYGTHPGAWRAPGVDPSSYTDFDQMVRYAQAAERGKLQFLFVPDQPVLAVDVEEEAPQFTLDPLLTLAAIARGTERIGMVATGSTTFSEPYNLARQFKALDVMSHGRAGWNAVPTSNPAAAANFGAPIPPRPQKYERVHETIQIVQALWGSWERDAWTRDPANGRFADPAKIRPINLSGNQVASRGPLPIPPSEQGQPVIFQAGGGGYGLEVAGRYGSGIIGAPHTIEAARAERAAARDAAERAGRNPDEIKFFAGVMPSIAPTKRAALDRRIALGTQSLPRLVPYLGSMLNLDLRQSQLDRPLTSQQVTQARATPHDPRSANALRVAREGWTVREILAHGVIDYHPVVPGPASDTADHMQEWFEAGVVDGFWLIVDVYADGVDTLVDELIPILQERRLFHLDYEGTTLRDHLGIPEQYGIDRRLTATE